MPQLNYLAQVVPPSLTADHFSRFDAGVADLVLQLMTLSGECISPVCADARLYYLKLPRSKCDYDYRCGLTVRA